MRNLLMPALMLSATLSLASCGGGGGGSTPTNTPPVANFTVTPTNLAVSTANTSSDADAGETATLTYEWSWGDGSPVSTGTAPNHTYATAGTFTVTLKTTDVKGASNSKSASVTVSNPAPVAPTILSVSPAPGSLGNLINVPVVITFSTAMNTFVTQGAYSAPAVAGSTGLLTNPVTSYSWSPDGKVLTIVPTTPTTYSLTPTIPNKYNYAITVAALSAAGLPLATQYSGDFSTAVQHTSTIYSDPNKDVTVTDLASTNNFTVATGGSSPTMTIGDDAVKKAIGAYLSFDLGAAGGLPSTLPPANITSAVLKVKSSAAPTGSPYGVLNDGPKLLSIYSLFYGDTVDSSELQPLNFVVGTLNGSTPALTTTTFVLTPPSVLSAVKVDWAARVAQSNRSQYQLRFPNLTNGDLFADQQLIDSSKPSNLLTRPHLVITYLDDN